MKKISIILLALLFAQAPVDAQLRLVSKHGYTNQGLTSVDTVAITYASNNKLPGGAKDYSSNKLKCNTSKLWVYSTIYGYLPVTEVNNEFDAQWRISKRTLKTVPSTSPPGTTPDSGKIYYTYNSNGNEIKRQELRWNRSSNIWDTSLQHITSYNTNGDIQTYEIKGYSQSLNQFVGRRRHNYIYDKKTT